MYLGLDIGTSGIKGVIIDDQQRMIATAEAPLSISRPQAGWSEQNPADWLTATQQVFERLHAQHGRALAGVRGIGLSGQMHGAVLLDEKDVPLRPCILWNDVRSAAQCVQLEQVAPFRKITGNILMPGFTAPKLAWVRIHEPDIFARVKSVFLPKDYVRLWLTGARGMDMSDASGTGWLDVAARAWSQELLEAAGLPLTGVPPLLEGSAAAGHLRRALQIRWGMTDDVVVAAGGGDNAATACGLGVLDPGVGFISLGTSGVVFAATDSFAPNTRQAVHAFCHAVPNRWHQMGVILSATDSLTWLAGIAQSTPAELSARVPDDVTAPSSVLFLPYLSGERTPHNDAQVRGGFVGLDRAHSAGDLTQAVMEGVAFALADCLAALTGAGTHLPSVYITGGGAQSPAWCRIIANVMNMTLLCCDDAHRGAAFGAARLGMMAAMNVESTSLCTPPEVKQEITPQADLVGAYQERYAQYQAFYPPLAAYGTTDKT
ncbi:MAG: xylulokinase [Pseudomonadota bacterium]